MLQNLDAANFLSVLGPNQSSKLNAPESVAAHGPVARSSLGPALRDHEVMAEITFDLARAGYHSYGYLEPNLNHPPAHFSLQQRRQYKIVRHHNRRST